MTVFDSNIWIAYYNEQDGLSKRATDLFKKTFETVGIPEYVIIEVCTVLKKKVGYEKAIKFLNEIRTNEHVLILPNPAEMFYEMFDEFRSAQYPGLSFIDVSLLYLSSFHTIITFDKKLALAITKKAGL